MKGQTRNYLNEEWIEDQETEEIAERRERKNDDRPPPNPRQQKAKEWGRAMAKYHRQRKKVDRQ